VVYRGRKLRLYVDGELKLRFSMVERFFSVMWAISERHGNIQSGTSCRNDLPDFILLDNVMPNMNGLTALTKLRGSDMIS